MTARAEREFSRRARIQRGALAERRDTDAITERDNVFVEGRA